MKKDELDLLIKSGYLQAQPDNTLWQQELGNLVNQGFLEQLPNHYYTFNNNLTWEVVYETLLYAERRRLHEIVAKHIEKHNEDKLSSVADMLLYHYEKSNNTRKCILFACIAADRAAAMYANNDAISYYERALTFTKSLQRSSPADLSLIGERIGDAYDTIGEFKDAIDSYQKSLDVWRRSTKKCRIAQVPSWQFSPSKHEANICRKLAMAYEHSADYEESLKWLAEAESSLPSRPGIIACQIHATRSATLFRMGKYTAAIETGNNALKIAKRIKSKSDICYVNNMLANSYIRLGNFEHAKTLLSNSIDIYQSIDDFPGVATSYYILGECCAFTGDLDSASNYFSKALDVDLQLKNISSIAMDYYCLGSIHLMKGDFEKAITSFTNIVDLHNKGKVRRDLAGLTYIYLCTARRLHNELDLAEQSIKLSLQLLESAGVSQYLAEAQLELAELYLAQQRPEEAKAIVQDVITIAVDSGAKAILAKAYRILATIDNILKESHSPLDLINKSIKISKDVGLDNEEAYSIIAMAKFLLERNSINDDIKTELKHAIDILTKAGAKLDLAEAESLLQQVEKVLQKV